jgi:hypothetical protein
MKRFNLPNEPSLLRAKRELVLMLVNDLNDGANVLFVDGINDHAVIVHLAIRRVHGKLLPLGFQLA